MTSLPVAILAVMTLQMALETPKTKFGGDITSFEVTSGHYDVTSGGLGAWTDVRNGPATKKTSLEVTSGFYDVTSGLDGMGFCEWLDP